MSKIVFIDTETTSLRPDRRAWDVGLIVREPGQADKEYGWYVDCHDLQLGNADLFALKIGRFYERHPQADPVLDIPMSGLKGVQPEAVVMHRVERLTRGAHLVGAVVSFDAEVLSARMRAHGIAPSFHYHLIDVEALAVGWLATEADTAITTLPWSSDELTSRLGLDPVPEDERHTALGDARWARSIYDRVTGADR